MNKALLLFLSLAIGPHLFAEKLPFDPTVARAKNVFMALPEATRLFEGGRGDHEKWAKLQELCLAEGAKEDPELLRIRGQMILFGIWKETTQAEAMPFLEKAVELGDPQATAIVAEQYLHGHVLERDFEKALSLADLAIKRGALGGFRIKRILYEFGLGVVASPEVVAELELLKDETILEGYRQNDFEAWGFLCGSLMRRGDASNAEALASSLSKAGSFRGSLILAQIRYAREKKDSAKRLLLRAYKDGSLAAGRRLAGFFSDPADEDSEQLTKVFAETARLGGYREQFAIVPRFYFKSQSGFPSEELNWILPLWAKMMAADTGNNTNASGYHTLLRQSEKILTEKQRRNIARTGSLNGVQFCEEYLCESLIANPSSEKDSDLDELAVWLDRYSHRTQDPSRLFFAAMMKQGTSGFADFDAKQHERLSGEGNWVSSFVLAFYYLSEFSSQENSGRLKLGKKFMDEGFSNLSADQSSRINDDLYPWFCGFAGGMFLGVEYGLEGFEIAFEFLQRGLEARDARSVALLADYYLPTMMSGMDWRIRSWEERISRWLSNISKRPLSWARELPQMSWGRFI